MRRIYATEGQLCRTCLGKAYLKHQLGNLFLGWWGYISFVMTFVFLLGNTISYFSARRDLNRVHQRCQVLQPDAQGTPSERLAPFRHNVRLRLRAGEAEAEIAEDLSRTHQVPVADAVNFVADVVASAAQAS